MEKINFRRRIVLLFFVALLLIISALPVFEIFFRRNLAPYFEIANQNIYYFGLQFKKDYFIEIFLVNILVSCYFMGNIGYIIFKLIKGARLIKKDKNTHSDFIRNQTW